MFFDRVTFFGGALCHYIPRKISESLSELEFKCLVDADASRRATGESFDAPKPAGVAACNKAELSDPLFPAYTIIFCLFLVGIILFPISQLLQMGQKCFRY